MTQLELDPEKRYVIDTSSLVDIRLETDATKVWEGIFRLINQGKLFTVPYAFPEITRMVASGKVPGVAYKRLKEVKKQLVIPDAEIIREAGRINHLYPKLGDWRDPRNRADPWIIAAAKVRGYRVVTEEADTGEKKTRRIPWVCDRENVQWLRMSRLIVEEQLIEEEQKPSAQSV